MDESIEYMEDIAAAVRFKYLDQLADAANRSTHKMFGDTGIYKGIDDIVEELAGRYEKRENIFYQTLAKIGKGAELFGIPVLSGAVAGAYFSYFDSETAMEGIKVGAYYGAWAGLVINGVGALLHSLLGILTDANYAIIQTLKERDPQNPMAAVAAEHTAAMKTWIQELDNIGDYELRAKHDVLQSINSYHSIRQNTPLRILQIPLKPMVYIICGSIVNLYPAHNYESTKFLAMGLAHCGLSELLLPIKNRIKTRQNKKLFEIIDILPEEERQLLVGGLVNRWFGRFKSHLYT